MQDFPCADFEATSPTSWTYIQTCWELAEVELSDQIHNIETTADP